MPKSTKYVCDNCGVTITDDSEVEVEITAQGYGTDPEDEDSYLPDTEINEDLVWCRACYQSIVHKK